MEAVSPLCMFRIISMTSQSTSMIVCLWSIHYHMPQLNWHLRDDNGGWQLSLVGKYCSVCHVRNSFLLSMLRDCWSWFLSPQIQDHGHQVQRVKLWILHLLVIWNFWEDEPFGHMKTISLHIPWRNLCRPHSTCTW